MDDLKYNTLQQEANFMRIRGETKANTNVTLTRSN